MITFIYAVIAIVFLSLVIVLRRKPQPRDPDQTLIEKSYAPKVGNGRWLDLSERIFDPSDARWLAEELAFPQLAKDLIDERKRLAIHWLHALQTGFDDLARTPQVDSKEGSVESWKMLWLILRFKVLVSYALLVVKLFGPYHRLIPSFAWVTFSPEQSTGRTAMAGSRTSN